MTDVPPALARFLLAVDTDGLTGVAGDGDRAATLVRLARRARARGGSPVVADVLADPSAPEVARSRALGQLARYLRDDDLTADSSSNPAKDDRRSRLSVADRLASPV